MCVKFSISLYAAFRPSWTRQQGFAVSICVRTQNTVTDLDYRE